MGASSEKIKFNQKYEFDDAERVCEKKIGHKKKLCGYS